MARAAKTRMLWGERIPMAGGGTLHATVYLPETLAAASPVLFTMTPYVAQTYHDVALAFASAGYPFVTVDVRGRGNSDGVFAPLVHEREDSRDIIQWLANQDYCDGRVAMWGGSYGGYVQWAAAANRPAPLLSIAPVASPFMGVDYPYRNNCAMPYWMQWLTLITGRASQDKMFWEKALYWGTKFADFARSGRPFKDLDDFLGNPSRVFQAWVAHPHIDDYWDQHNLAPADYAGIDIPILTITGAFDADQLGALAHYRRHRAHGTPAARDRHFLVIGPWDHAGTRAPQRQFSGITTGPNSMVDLHGLHVQWYDWTLRGKTRPPFLERNVAYYVMVADRWRYTDTLDAVTDHHCDLYLRSDGQANDLYRSGRLSLSLPGDDLPDEYVYDPADSSLYDLESSVDPEDRSDDRMIHASLGRRLVYHSEPFAEDTEISGFFSFEAWLAIDQPDTDFHVAIYEIDLRGQSIRLSADWLRARHRDGLRQMELVETPEPLAYRLDNFMFISRLVRKGHRLRLVVGPHDSIYHQRNMNCGRPVSEQTAADARVVTVRLFHDALRPSRLRVPIGAPSLDGAA